MILVSVVLAACDARANLRELARDTCAEIEGAIVLQVGPILSRATSEAEDLGFEAGELGVEMNVRCPETMAALQAWLSGQQEADFEQQERDALPWQMVVEVTRCTQNGAEGTVTNNSDATVDIFIQAHFLDGAGTIVDDSLDSVSAVRPGETAQWSAPYLGRSSYSRCRAEVSSVFPK